MSQATTRRYLLPEEELPTHYYNIAADLPEPLPPPLHPATREPVGPADLAPLFPMELIKQEVSAERFIPIPEPVRDAYRIYRPSPLVRALGLERSLDTPARIYYKYEGGSPAGSHKPNTAIAQAFYNREEGVQPARHRDGCRPVGERPRLRRRAVRPGDEGLHGQGQLRAEALPAQLHPDHGRQRDAVAVRGDERRSHHPGARTPTPPVRWASPSARRWRWRPPTRTPSTRWAAC